MKIIYQKRNGEIIERIRQTYCPYRVGETTSMGWKVIDILYPYKDNYYHFKEYDRLIDADWKKAKRKYKFKQDFKIALKNVNLAVNIFIIIKAMIFISFKAF